ncbi:hypothetical protein HN011_004913, partial [Eciton burchellii]
MSIFANADYIVHFFKKAGGMNNGLEKIQQGGCHGRVQFKYCRELTSVTNRISNDEIIAKEQLRAKDHNCFQEG